MLDHAHSSSAFDRAKKSIAGGVNSPVRSFKSVGGVPPFIAEGNGAYITDIDGNRYLDFVGSWGPLILGHAYPAVIEAIAQTARGGTSFGAPTERETELAELIISMIPSIELIRFVNSGTEATMSAIRLARGVTGRDLIVKFEGCYHGHGDSFLIAAGSGAATLGIPDSSGVPPAVAAASLIVPYNDRSSVETLFAQHGDNIAAVIVEPVAGNMGVVPPAPGFLQSLRSITQKYGALLIFDEVMTGFRVSPGGAQFLYDVKPDITTLGKIIGGGLPLGAYGGLKNVLSQVAPLGPVYQAGTLSGNPLAVAAGLTTLKTLRDNPDIYDSIDRNARRLADGLRECSNALGIASVVNRVGSMLTVFFTKSASVQSYANAKECDTMRFGRFFHAMLDRGVYLPPSPFEAWFVSAAHTGADIDTALCCCRDSLKHLMEYQ